MSLSKFRCTIINSIYKSLAYDWTSRFVRLRRQYRLYLYYYILYNGSLSWSFIFIYFYFFLPRDFFYIDLRLFLSCLCISWLFSMPHLPDYYLANFSGHRNINNCVFWSKACSLYWFTILSLSRLCIFFLSSMYLPVSNSYLTNVSVTSTGRRNINKLYFLTTCFLYWLTIVFITPRYLLPFFCVSPRFMSDQVSLYIYI